VFSGYIFTQGKAASRETGHALQWKACKKIVYAVFMQQSFLRDCFHFASKTRLQRLKVPGLCTMVWHSASFSTS